MKLSSKGSISIIEAYKLPWDSPQPLQEITWGRYRELEQSAAPDAYISQP